MACCPYHSNINSSKLINKLGSDNPSNPTTEQNPQLSLPFNQSKPTPTPSQTPATFKCQNCGKIDYETDDFPIWVEKGRSKILICEDCDQNFRTCPNCHRFVEKNILLLPNQKNKWSMTQGGCKECSVRCSVCKRVVDQDNSYSHDQDNLCEDCFSEYFTFCENCNETIDREHAVYVEGSDGDLCQRCYNDLYVNCEKCKKTISKDDAQEINRDYYCENCYEQVVGKEYEQFTSKFDNFSYTKKDRYLLPLLKLLPISIKELKTNHPNLVKGLGDLIAFSGGKPLTQEIVLKYRSSLIPEKFPIEYTTWSGIQRSLDRLKNNNPPQLVINVIASPGILQQLHQNPALYDLFDHINTLSKQSTHPYVKDQIGWVRVELDPNNEYILVDEVQSDHSNAGFRLKTGNDDEAEEIKSALKIQYKLNDDGLNKLLAEYIGLLKDFPNIAAQAVSGFAKQNNFKKIFWHTYESGKGLKQNEPPRSIYEKTPKENLFQLSSNQPFGLPGQFFEREASKIKYLLKLSNTFFHLTRK